MFKDFGKKTRLFHGFPNLNFQMNNEAYGFSGAIHDFDARYNVNTNTNLAAISYWQDRIRGVVASQATAGNQPRYVSSDPSFNNLPSIDYFSTARYTPLNNLISCFDVTVAIVYQVAAFLVQNRFMVDASNGIMLGGTDSNNTGLGVYSGLTASDFDTTIENTNPHIGILSITDGGHIIIDGVTEMTGQNPPIKFSANSFGTSNTSATVRGKISRILIFNTPFTEADCLTLSYRMNVDYAIY